MLREDFTLEEFRKIFQAFNDAVYHDEAKKLVYKSWRNINSWSKGEYEKIRVSKEWVRRKNDDDSYSDLEMIFVGPWDSNRTCPNPEELNLNDGSLGSWLDGVLIREQLMALNSCCSNIDKVAYGGATAYDSIADTGKAITSLRDAMENLQSSICVLNDSSSVYYSTGTDWTNVSAPPRYELKSDNLYIDGKPFNEYLQEYTDTEKENKTMNFNFDFGPVDSSVRMSMYGMAVKNAANTYVAYDAQSKKIMDVDILNFEGANKFMYKMPVAIKDVRCGDVVIHMRKPMIVVAAYSEGTFKVVDVFNGEEKTIVPARSPFGWDFMTKVVSLVNFGSASDAHPFGNMLPFLLMSDSKSKDDNLLPLLMMANGGKMDTSNPMMLYFLAGNRTNDPMMLAMLMGGFGTSQSGCTCGGSCHCNKTE